MNYYISKFVDYSLSLIPSGVFTHPTPDSTPLQLLEGLWSKDSLLLHYFDDTDGQSSSSSVPPFILNNAHLIKAIVRFPNGYCLALLHTKVIKIHITLL